MMDGVLLRPSDEDFIYVQANGDFELGTCPHRRYVGLDRRF